MAGAWRAGDAKAARRDNARFAAPRLPQHQLRDTRHLVPQILEALPPAIEDGLRLPIVYNTSSYDSLDSLRLMHGIARHLPARPPGLDIRACRRHLRMPGHPQVAREAAKEISSFGIPAITAVGVELNQKLAAKLDHLGLSVPEQLSHD